MFLLEGATRDPRVAAAALSVEQDISGITQADIQRLAREYLVPARQWSLSILPKGMTLADAAALDRAVDRCYRRQPFTGERERVEFLFALYERLAAPLLPAPGKARTARAAAMTADSCFFERFSGHG